MMTEVDHISVFLSHFAQNMPGWPPQVFLAINMFTLVAVHLYPLYFPGNKLKHPSKCTILKVIKKIDLCSHAPRLTQCMCINVCVDTLGIICIIQQQRLF